MYRLRSVEVNNKGKMSSGVAVVEGIAAFACVPLSNESKCTTPPLDKSSKIRGDDRHTDAGGHFYACTTMSPQLMLERLGKDIAEVADGPVNLLDTIGIDIQFRKTLTRKRKRSIRNCDVICIVLPSKIPCRDLFRRCFPVCFPLL